MADLLWQATDAFPPRATRDELAVCSAVAATQPRGAASCAAFVGCAANNTTGRTDAPAHSLEAYVHATLRRGFATSLAEDARALAAVTTRRGSWFSRRLGADEREPRRLAVEYRMERKRLLLELLRRMRSKWR